MQVITNAFVKTAVLEECFEKKTKESVVGTFKNICTVAVHYWDIKDAFAGFWHTHTKKSESILVAGCFQLNSKFISESSSLLQRGKSFM